MARTKIDSSLISPFTTTFIGVGRNRAINGEMSIDQKNAGTVATANNATLAYVPDMFLLLSNFGGALDGVMTIQQLSATPPTGFLNYARITVTTADASVTAAQNYEYLSAIEGNNVRDILFGSANAKNVALSFWVRSSVTGTFGGGVVNEAQDRSYVFQYTINAANTWEYKTITLVGDTGGTWVTGTGRGVQLFWDMGSGTNAEGTANTWNTAAPARWRASGNTRLISTAAATWDITGVQFEIGFASTSFEFLPFQTHLTNCQRYYEKSYFLNIKPGTVDNTSVQAFNATQIGATTVATCPITYKVTKRVNPTVTLYNRVSGTAGSWTWVSTAGASTARTTTVSANAFHSFAASQTVALEFYGEGHWTSDAGLQ